MLLVNPAYPDVTTDWFDPAHWGTRAQPVAAGGRGSAWFIDTPRGGMVLRHYRRGGMAARLSERSYVFTGWRNTRSRREFELLEALSARDLPVPEPVAACARRYGLWYHAAILIRRIPEAVPLPEVENLEDEALWREVGKTLRRFHDAGLDHVDLNCDNILVAGGKVYLIDFDRCTLRNTPRHSAWTKRNLDRLHRSVEKRVPVQWRDHCWSRLLSGYAPDLRA